MVASLPTASTHSISEYFPLGHKEFVRQSHFSQCEHMCVKEILWFITMP